MSCVGHYGAIQMLYYYYYYYKVAACRAALYALRTGPEVNS